ncbi:MAG TPA: glycosyltransferase family A protein, partial [Acidimicrobiales bacterium]|nr:glycosyltransferase family A protein [Acidimicrobiales bacterium]
MSKAELAIAVVVPAGPRDDVVDTVASVVHFTSQPRRIVVVDDTATAGAVGRALSQLSPDVEVLPAPPRSGGGYGGLWCKIAQGYKHVIETFPFDVLLRLDADAMMLGPGLAKVAYQFFEVHPDVGMLGSYRVGADGGARDWSPAAKVLRAECGMRGADRPVMRATLRRLRSLARSYGYQDGEHP